MHIDTATPRCSVALSRGEQLLGVRETSEKNAHSRVVTIFAEELLKSAGIFPSSLDAISVSMGPGSYTGLRIGVSAAKGFCYALDKPLIAISTLRAMAVGMKQFFDADNEAGNILYCPMIDARRMEVYSTLFDHKGYQIREIRAEIIDRNSFKDLMDENILVFAGDGAAKCKTVFENSSHARFIDDFKPSAQYMIPLAMKKFRENSFEDVAYFEPFYLKDFIAGVPKVKGLK